MRCASRGHRYRELFREHDVNCFTVWGGNDCEPALALRVVQAIIGGESGGAVLGFDHSRREAAVQNRTDHPGHFDAFRAEFRLGQSIVLDQPARENQREWNARAGEEEVRNAGFGNGLWIFHDEKCVTAIS